MSSLKIKKGSKVRVKDIISYRFSRAEMGSGEIGEIVTINEVQSCVYVEIPSLVNDILWYDLTEIDVI